MSPISNAILISIFFGVFWLIVIRPQAKQVSNSVGLEKNLPKASKHVGIDETYKAYREALGKWFQFALPSFGFTVAFMFMLAIFLWKIFQTSDFALRYSTQAQAEIGSWAIGLFILFIAMNCMGIPALLAARSFVKKKDALVSRLKNALVYTEEQSLAREKIEVEEMLGKLSRSGNNVFSSWNNKV